ncbi:MAG TPA: hypothetical protein PKA20_27400 [Burkholderiaceae bacterium]|nr:hypothetical protein [Burkholderiaceae bacterium]
MKTRNLPLGLGRLLSLFLGLSLVAALNGCGGSEGAGAQGGNQTAGGGNSGVNGSAQIQLTADKSVLSASGATPVNVTATLVDGNGVVLANKNVTWAVKDSASSLGVRLQNAQTKTDATGKVGAELVLSGDQTNRTVTVSATSEGITSSIDIQVGGTKILVSGPQTVAFNVSTPSVYTITLLDDGEKGLGGKSLAVSSRAGNQLSATTITTDSAGKATVGLTGTKGGADVLTVTGMGVTQTYDLSVAEEALAIQPPAAEIPIGTSATVVVTYTKSGGIPPGATVALTSTRGTVTPSTPVSIASGVASFTVSSSTAGPVTFAAVVGTTQGSAVTNFISTTPAAIDLQATPAIVGPGANSTLIAMVRDAAGNAVKNQIVAFTKPTDPSGGTIEPATAVTDASGRATSTFVAGPTSTAPNGVVVQAQVVGTAVTSPNALISVSRTPLFVRIETDNTLVKEVDPPVYRKRYAVVVTDSTGSAVPNASVQIRLTPLRYRTGSYSRVGSAWVQNVTGTFASEDTGTPLPGGPNASGYRDGVCQAGEDVNGDGQLTPGNVASASSASTTNVEGIASVLVTYPQGFAAWVEVVLEATIRVGGSEGANATVFWLPILAADLTAEASPPGALSPFPYTSERATCP